MGIPKTNAMRILEKEKINRDEFEALFEEKTVEASAE